MDVFVARQPIFNRRKHVVAYELLFRNDWTNAYQATDGDKATSGVITNGLFIIGLDTLTAGKRAFINFTENLLTSDMPTLLPNKSVVIEILETVEPTPQVLHACGKLKAQGYVLALDDFVFTPKYRPLIDIADIIKVDFHLTVGLDRAKIMQQVGTKKVRFLAEKVETNADFEQALHLGYSLFQGYFFSKPMIVSSKDIPGNKVLSLKLLKEVNDPNIDFNRLEETIRCDVSLTYKLLRYINSATFGFRTEINSIKQALTLMGGKEIRKWLSLIIMRDMGSDKPDELVVNSMVRARFSELLSRDIGLKQRSQDFFLMGLLSLVDVLIERPMADILNDLSITADVKKALLGQPNILHTVYELIISYEQGNWDNIAPLAHQLAIPESRIPELFGESLAWVKDSLESF